MTKKFTEEQYQKIVETVNKYPDFGSVYYVQNGWVESKPTNTFNELIEALSYTVSGESEVNRMLALSNPLTREWAHDKFVEKEKRYVWTSKEVNSSRKHKRLYIHQQSASVKDYFVLDQHGYDGSELITESEIKKWGYDPERFYREEV